MAERSAVTLGDVARLAQVSLGTASKGLNGRGSMRPATRQRIHDAARALRFGLSDRDARMTLRRRTGTVGLITDDSNGRFSLPILAGAEDEFGAECPSILLCDSRGDAARERAHLRSLLARGVDGLILVGHSGNPRPPLAEPVPVPVVYALSPSLDPGDVSVASDDILSGRLATEHAVALGRRRVIHLGGDPSYVVAGRRAEGGAIAMRVAGLEFAVPPLFGDWKEGWGRDAVAGLIARGIPFDALTCGSDQIARGALDALAMHGLRVPEDVVVVGHDNREDIVVDCRVPVTSVDMNLVELGERAARLLVDAWRGEVSRGIEYREPRLVVRATSR